MIVRNWMQHNPTLVDGDTLLSEAKRILINVGIGLVAALVADVFLVMIAQLVIAVGNA